MTAGSDPVSEVSRARVASLYPGVRPLAYRCLQDVVTVTQRRMNVASSFRPMGTQQALFHQGRELINGTWKVVDPKKIVTNAKPGLSWHCYGLAFDCSWAGNDPYLESLDSKAREDLWQQYGSVVRNNGLRWGGDFKLVNGTRDLPHAEMTFGLTLDQVVALYDHGGIRAVWTWLDQHRGVAVGEQWNLKEGV